MIRQTAIITFMILVTISCEVEKQEKPIVEVVNEALEFSQKQSLRMAGKYAGQDKLLPHSFENGEMETVSPKGWTSGFFAGVLWYLYENSKNDSILAYAREYTARLEDEKYTTDNHDIGFILYCSYGNGLRLTQDTTYRDVLLTGAESLSTRYNPQVGLIRSWDFHQDLWQYPVIIDNMMNLELLLWASKTSGNNQFKDIAISHADKTMENHYRDDYSCYHVVSYDTISGLPEIKQTFQGYSDESSWARGQAWGLYGYTFMYRETKLPSYLELGENIASYMINHPNMPEDYIPYWDFDAPDIPEAPRDASAAAVMASALIELSEYVETEQADLYLKVAEKQIRTLASPKYTANIGENGDFILKHSVGFLPENISIDVPLNYADYYYVEALTRLKKRLDLK